MQSDHWEMTGLFLTDQWDVFGMIFTDQWRKPPPTQNWGKTTCFLHWPIGGRLLIVLTNKERQHAFYIDQWEGGFILCWPMRKDNMLSTLTNGKAATDCVDQSTDCVDQWGKTKWFLHWPMGGEGGYRLCWPMRKDKMLSTLTNRRAATDCIVQWGKPP